MYMHMANCQNPLPKGLRFKGYAWGGMHPQHVDPAGTLHHASAHPGTEHQATEHQDIRHNGPTGPGEVHNTVQSIRRDSEHASVHAAVHNTIHSTTTVHSDGSTLYNAVARTVYSTVDRTASNTVHRPVRTTIHRTVHSAVYSAVHSTIHSTVLGTVHITDRWRNLPPVSMMLATWVQAGMEARAPKVRSRDMPWDMLGASLRKGGLDARDPKFAPGICHGIC